MSFSETALPRIPRDGPVLIAGPTASGKSALAMDLAARDGRLIVNADALQVYANWRILTARPSAAETAALPHALYGQVARETAFSVGDWLRAVTDLLASGRPLVIVGGTGLYFTALTQGLVTIPPIPPAIRAEADLRRSAQGVGGLGAELDPETAARIDMNNPMRVQRAWEVLRATGQGLARWQADTPPPVLPLSSAHALVLHPAKPWLDARIARRFDQMLALGVLDEVVAELPHWQPARPSAQAIGAAALIDHLQGRLSLSQARDQAVLATTQYARRQRKFFRARMAGWTPLAMT